MNVFERVEQKYVLTEEDYKKLMKELKGKIKKDEYYKTTVCNLYLDTKTNDLIIKSIEKPLYKEKVRIRSYNVPKKSDNVFLELKRKYNGIVYKRRIKIRLEDCYQYLETGKKKEDSQIMEELDYIIKRKKLRPKLFIAYDRMSYYDKEDKNFRITFDTNLRSRTDNLLLEYGDRGKQYSEEKLYIMELKSLKALPLWFVDILSKLKIYPQSFSKYGKIYKKGMKNYV